MNKYHSGDLRKGRRSEPGRAYFITTTTWHRERIFLDLHAARIVIKGMKYLHENDYVESLCFVVMPDHLHWLFVLGERLSLPSTINLLKSWSTRRIRKSVYGLDRVWQKGFHDRAVRRDEDLRQIARYIVANPLRAGLVNRVGDYPMWDANWM